MQAGVPKIGGSGRGRTCHDEYGRSSMNNSISVGAPASSIGETIHFFAESFEGLADLRLVRAVDETVDVLLAEAKFYRGHAVTGRSIITKITSMLAKAGEFMDESGELESTLREVIDRCETLLSLWAAKKGTIDCDGRLAHGHCDMLHSAYDNALVALARLNETTKNTLAAVISHDLKAETWDGKVYVDVHDLHADILKQ